MEQSVEYLKGVSDAAKAIGLKMDELFKKANDGLKSLNENMSERERQEYAGMTRFTVSEEYMINVAPYAWGYRGQKISLLYLGGLVDILRDNPEKINIK